LKQLELTLKNSGPTLHSKWQPVGLYFSAFEICMTRSILRFITNFIIDNDTVFDLISKKKINVSTNYPDQQKQTTSGIMVPGLSLVAITDLAEFDDALTLCVLNGKIK
jgi:hypothetical protein